MRVAICLRGGVSKIVGHNNNCVVPPRGIEYIDYVACYRSIKKHIIDANPTCMFDVFIHSWSTDLEQQLIDLYNPVSHKFEDNNVYHEQITKYVVNPIDYGGISQALAIKKSIELMETYEQQKNITYDSVIIYRPDVLLWKDMKLSYYKEGESNSIYVNAHSGGNGDFHFIMTSAVAREFKYLYDSLEKGNVHKVHSWIKQYVETIMKKKLIMDNIVPGRDQEVLRKIQNIIDRRQISLDILQQFGLTVQECRRYAE